ncbi:uncharacterized protein TNCV_255901 [Trichonephila clavipes]|nr:uncharacterized protein TNCV_255901 [Trichonephila clavipes]
MPANIKQLMPINPPTSPTEWLMVATRLIIIQAPKLEQTTFRQNVPIRPRQNTFVPQNCYSFQPNFQNFNRIRPQHPPNQHAHNFNNRYFRLNHHTHLQHGLPPYPCKICTQQGIPNAYHWKLQCPFNQHQQGKSHLIVIQFWLLTLFLRARRTLLAVNKFLIKDSTPD